MGEYAKLERIDLTDNYISELGQVKCLQNFRQLRSLAFRQVGQESKGKNPICDLSNYTITLKMYCLYLSSLDGISLNS